MMKENLTEEEADAVIELNILIDKDDEVTTPSFIQRFLRLFLGNFITNLHQTIV